MERDIEILQDAFPASEMPTFFAPVMLAGQEPPVEIPDEVLEMRVASY